MQAPEANTVVNQTVLSVITSHTSDPSTKAAAEEFVAKKVKWNPKEVANFLEIIRVN